MGPWASVAHLSSAIERCEHCPRLRTHCQEVARLKRKSYLSDTYWGRPIAGFGDPKARVWIVGLAPAAHGANRTGRIFTGDRSGDWLYRALHKVGFANQPTSTHREDGLKLRDVFISCVARCAPPDNKPEPDEIMRCKPYLEAERELLTEVRVVIALGGIAWKACLDLFESISEGSKKRAPFGHGASTQFETSVGGERRTVLLLGSYHPSQQNTFTGRLTEPMFDSVFENAKKALQTRKLKG